MSQETVRVVWEHALVEMFMKNFLEEGIHQTCLQYTTSHLINRFITFQNNIKIDTWNTKLSFKKCFAL